MARFDLLDEYTSIITPGTRKRRNDAWSESFEDSYLGVLQQAGKTERSMIFGGLFLLTIAGAVLGLIRKNLH